MKVIKITKISGKPDSRIQPGYFVIGCIEEKDLVLNQQLVLDPVIKTSLNEPFEWFMTTKIKSLVDGVLTTLNSQWRFEVIEEQPKEENDNDNLQWGNEVNSPVG